MEKQKVFIPVSVEKELPPDDNYYHTIDAEGEPNCRTKESFKDFDEISTAFWLKESKGYFFPPESLKEFVAECVGFVWGRYGTEKDREEQCKKLIESLNIK